MLPSRHAPLPSTTSLGPAPPVLPVAQWRLLGLIGLHRACYLVPAAVAGASSPHRWTPLDLALLATAVCWTAVLLAVAARNGGVRTGAVTGDVLVTGSLLLAAGVGPGGLAADSPSALWLTGIAQSCAVLLGAAVRYLPLAVIMMVFLLATQATAGGGDAATTISSLVLLAAVAWVMARRQKDRPPAAPMRIHQVLHDGPLTTLTAIARGGLDHRAVQVQRRCARDADRIRRLLAGDLDGDDGGNRALPGVLREAVEAAEALGLRVHLRVVDVPDDLPHRLTDALHGAVGEALTNVQRHSGTAEAWVTAVGPAGRLRVTVVDRGAGFDTGATSVRCGFGLQHSIIDRMADAGGRAVICSAPHSGTCVELSWPQ